MTFLGTMEFDAEYEFSLASLQLKEKYYTTLPNFLPYFNKMQSTLLEFLFLPSKNNKAIAMTWKNNLCESMNHILQLTCNWKVQNMLDLVEKLYKVV